MPETKNYRLNRYLFNAIPVIKDQVVDGPRAAAEIARQWMDRNGSWSKETFMMVGLNARGKPVVFDEVAIGTLSACLVHPREIFRSAIIHGCHAIILMHTHPSGEADPSEEDIELTVRVAEAGRVNGIPLVDHVVVTPDDFQSCGPNSSSGVALTAAEVAP